MALYELKGECKKGGQSLFCKPIDSMKAQMSKVMKIAVYYQKEILVLGIVTIYCQSPVYDQFLTSCDSWIPIIISNTCKLIISKKKINQNIT